MTKIFPAWFIVRVTSLLTLIFFASQTLALLAQEADKLPAKQQIDVALRASLQAERERDFKTAIAKIDEAMKLGFKQPSAHHKKGCLHFELGNMSESLKEFDRFAELQPSSARWLWQRGIACYYMKKYKAGAAQFVSYQSADSTDVENAVWRYLCQSKFDGKKKARASMLPIKNDTRVPMMEVYRLFRGESKPERVLAVLKKEKSTGPQAKTQQFDAHLYLALFYDSEGQLAAAKDHIDMAIKQARHGDNMWCVAVKHQKHINEQLANAKKDSEREK